MRRYRACGLTIAADRTLPELTPARSAAVDWTIRTGALPPRRNIWFRRTYLHDRRPWLAAARHSAGYTLQFGRLASFDIAPEARTITCAAARGVARTTVRHLLLDQVLPLLASSRQRLALHASAVVAPSLGTVAFLGDAGRGKSTLAAALATGGWPLVCDDALLVERRGARLVTLPAYPGVRLFPDALGALFRTRRAASTRVADYSPKRRVAAASLPFARRAAPLRRIYIVGTALRRPRTGAIVAPRSPRESMMDVLKHVLSIDPMDSTCARNAFELTAAIADQVPVRLIRCALGLERLDEIRAAIIRDVASGR